MTAAPETEVRPDYRVDVIDELRVETAASLRLAGELLQSRGTGHALSGLKGCIDGIAHTLLFLEQAGSELIASELFALLAALESPGDTPGHREEIATALLRLLEALDTCVNTPGLMLPGDSAGAALALLPALNESRAARRESLLSAALLHAAGIALPETRSRPLPGELDSLPFLDQVRALRPSLVQNLLGWFRTPQQSDERLGHLEQLFASLADAAAGPTLAGLFCDAYRAAAIVCRTLREHSAREAGVSASLLAIRRLFAQLERQSGALLGAFDQGALQSREGWLALYDESLLRNLLYYMAGLDGQHPDRAVLVHDYGLERFAGSLDPSLPADVRAAGLSHRTDSGIRDSLLQQTEALRQWLSQAASDASSPQARTLLGRLESLRPALTLYGKPGTRELLDRITTLLADAAGRHGPLPAERRLAMAESLLRLEHAITLTGDWSAATLADAERQCLHEATCELRLVETRFFEQGAGVGILNSLELLDKALLLLPMPEVLPLTDGVRAATEQHAHAPLTAERQADLATLIVTLDAYLGAVMRGDDAASLLLVSAEEALHRLHDGLSGESNGGADEAARESDGIAPDGHGSAARAEDIETALEVMDRLGRNLDRWPGAGRGTDSVAADEVIRQQRLAWQDLSRSSRRSGAGDLQRLADANLLLLADAASVAPESLLALQHESLAVLPQLIQRQAAGERVDVHDFDRLLADLTRRRDIETLDLPSLDASLEDDAALTLDNTLQQVFQRECSMHLDTLGAALDRARASLGEQADRRVQPPDDMLRALHTLTGSAQTVSADGIVDLVQPFQRLALQRHRLQRGFDAAELAQLSAIVGELRRRQLALSGSDAPAPDRRFEATLQAMLEDGLAEPALSVVPDASSVSPAAASLQDVFDEEARELLGGLHDALERLASADATDATTVSEAREALRIGLHTLKGSARMADRRAIADQAHMLETELLQSDDPVRDSVRLQSGLATIQKALLDTETSPPLTAQPAGGDSLQLSDESFERLLSLASDGGISQARLGACLQSLRDTRRELDIAVERLRRLPGEALGSDAAAAREIVLDLDTARRNLGNDLRVAMQAQHRASRAGTQLQQALIRAQLVTLQSGLLRWRRVLEDTARECDRQVSISLHGGELTLDHLMFRRVQHVLEHLVRNAVVHGIEPTATRVKAGKPARGTVGIRAVIDGTDLVVAVSDDGQGVDAAVLAGTGNTMESLCDRLCAPGFSSLAEATQLAGRGMGLATVRQLVDAIGGCLDIQSTPGEGVTVTLRVPQRVIVQQTVLVVADGRHFALPVASVQRVVAHGDDEWPAGESWPDGTALHHHGERFVVSELAALLSGDTARRDTQAGAASAGMVLVSAAGHHAALRVDRVIGYREIITQPLGPQMAALQRYTGGSVLPDGTQVLIPDMARLLLQAGTHRGGGADISDTASSREARPSLREALIVDDSITMRVAAERLLNGFGFRPVMARDGEEAREYLRHRLPAVMLLDIDMPRLNGFDLLRHLAALRPDHDLPIVMVSSRDSRANRREAAKLGAGAFLSKPYTERELGDALQSLGLAIGAEDPVH